MELGNSLDLPTRRFDANHVLGRVHSFESFGTADGPGTRFVLFLQGCMFRCKYCHNRDTWPQDEGKLYTVSDMINEILPYTPFFDSSKGGVTISGGEPLLQRHFVSLLFKLLRFQDVHTCLDSNGYLQASAYDADLDKLLDNTNLVMLDIKQMDPAKHMELTGVKNEYTLRFAEHLNRINKPTWIRYVVVPGHTDAASDIEKLASFIAPMKNVEKVELLPYHNLGEHKWKAFNDDNGFKNITPPSTDQLEAIKAQLESFDLSATF